MHAGTVKQTPTIQRKQKEKKKKREKTTVPEKGEELDLQIVEVKDFDKFQKQLNSLYINFNRTTIDSQMKLQCFKALQISQNNRNV